MHRMSIREAYASRVSRQRDTGTRRSFDDVSRRQDSETARSPVETPGIWRDADGGRRVSPERRGSARGVASVTSVAHRVPAAEGRRGTGARSGESAVCPTDRTLGGRVPKVGPWRAGTVFAAATPWGHRPATLYRRRVERDCITSWPRERDCRSFPSCVRTRDVRFRRHAVWAPGPTGALSGFARLGTSTPGTRTLRASS